MNWFSTFLNSSIGKKFVMGITGLSLIAFLVVHCGINSCIFINDGGKLFNEVAHFMGSNIFIRTAEIGLFAGLLIHIGQGLVLWRDNKKRRPIKYAVSAGNATSTWYSRSMGLLGTLLLFFLIVHLAHFWVPSRFGHLEPTAYGAHNLYAEMQEEFSEWWVVLLYVLSMVSLGYHLLHGFQSAFQTMGWTNKKYTPIVKLIGAGFSFIVPFIFALMPVLMFFGVIR